MAISRPQKQAVRQKSKSKQNFRCLSHLNVKSIKFFVL